MVKKSSESGLETDFKTKFRQDFKEDPELAYNRLQTAFDLVKVDLAAHSTELPTLSIQEKRFSQFAVSAIYRRILFTTLRHVSFDENQGNEVMSTCMDRYSPRSIGLITHISKAMASKSRIVLQKRQLSDGSFVLSKIDATPEVVDMKPDLFELDFTGYTDTDILKVYTSIMYDALLSAFRGVKMTRAILLGLYQLAEMLDTDEANAAVLSQVISITNAVRNGGTSVTDSNSKIEFVRFDIEPTEKIKNFVYQQYSSITGFPVSFFNGTGGSSLSDTGESDKKQTRQACEFYFYEVLNPALNAIFGKSFTLKPDIDIGEISTILEIVEASTILNEKGALFLLNQAGIKKEHVDLSSLNIPPTSQSDKVTTNAID
ncbi:hypothetical protein ACWO80_003449 [Vibrio cholerae]